MKRFKEFINEGITQYLKPKSEEEIEKWFYHFSEEKNALVVATLVKKYNLPNKYMPSKEEMIRALNDTKDIKSRRWENMDRYTKENKIKLIILWDLGFEHLPRNIFGRCVYDGTLNLQDEGITKLPDKLTVTGNLIVSGNKLTELPKKLQVGGRFYCPNNQLTELPEDLYVAGEMDCFNNVKKLEITEKLKKVMKGKFINE